MNENLIGEWTHDHTFGQHRQMPGERRTLIVVAITATMMVVEITCGVLYGSMALLADGLHMASHAIALVIAYGAYVFARRYARDERFSFGTGKVNSLAGFTGAILLAGFALMMAWESVDRLFNPVMIRFNQAIVVAIVGLVVNAVSAVILGGHGHSHDQGHEHGHAHEDDHDHGHHHHHDDHNLRSAYLHVIADALTSLFAIIALLGGKYLGLAWLDPVMGIVGATLVAHWSVGRPGAAGPPRARADSGGGSRCRRVGPGEPRLRSAHLVGRPRQVRSHHCRGHELAAAATGVQDAPARGAWPRPRHR
jgi:cation diffusion facilitator family transporter